MRGELGLWASKLKIYQDFPCLARVFCVGLRVRKTVNLNASPKTCPDIIIPNLASTQNYVGPKDSFGEGLDQAEKIENFADDTRLLVTITPRFFSAKMMIFEKFKAVRMALEKDHLQKALTTAFDEFIAVFSSF